MGDGRGEGLESTNEEFVDGLDSTNDGRGRVLAPTVVDGRGGVVSPVVEVTCAAALGDSVSERVGVLGLTVEGRGGEVGELGGHCGVLISASLTVVSSFGFDSSTFSETRSYRKYSKGYLTYKITESE